MRSKFVVSSLLVSMSASAWAGNSGSGMRHDSSMLQQQHFAQMEVNRRNQEAAERQLMLDRQNALEAKQREAAEAARIAEANRVERERIEADKKAAQAENDRLARELAAAQQKEKDRRAEIEDQRIRGDLNPNSLTANEVFDMFSHEANPDSKEYWATMIILLDPIHAPQAKIFLRETRGWTEEQLAGLNFN